jgi:PAS domain S-box-containing protein
MAKRDPSSPTPLPTILRYGIAVLSIAIATGLGLFLLRHLLVEIRLTPFLFAVAATVWYAGTGPGVLAIVLSVLSLNYFFLHSFFSFSPISYADLVYLTCCTFCALAVGWVSAVRRRTEQELRQAHEELDAKVVERTASLQRSERYLAEAQRLTHCGVTAYKGKTVFYGSEEIYRIWGFDPAQGVPSRKAVLQRIHPDDLDRLNAEVERALGEKRRYSIAYRIVLPDGTVKHLESIGQPVFSTNGELVEVVATQIDVTERKRAEQALRESEAKIRRLVDSNIIGIFFSGLEGRVLETNDAFLHLVGHDRDDLVSGRIRWTDLTPPEWRERDRRALAELTSNTTAQPYEKEFFRKDGSRVPVLIGGALFEEGGDEGVAFVLDLTERKRAEEALRASEQKLQTIIDTIPAHVVRYRPDGIADFMNQTFSEFVGPGVGFDKLRSVVHPEDYPERSRDWFAHLATGEPYDQEWRLRRADGVYRWHRSRRVPLRDANGVIVNWYGAGHDIDDQKRAEQALRRSEAYLSEAQRLSHTGSAAYNETEILYWSEEASRIWGFDPPQGIPSREAVWQRIHPDDRDGVNENIEHGVREKRSFANEFRIILPDGTIKHIESINHPVFSASGELLEIFGTPIDVTERKRAEEAHREAQLELAHANRVATMGQLTASITHEVNQPITAAVTYALAARRWLSAEPPNFHEVDDALSLIVKEGNRAGELVGRIRALIKKAPARKDAVEINDAILEVVALTRTEAANNSVSVRTQLAEGLPRVQGDRVQLLQVLLNLIINAIEAMRDVGEEERELLISTRNEPDGVSVEVRDSGPGFAPAALERVFEAFYTTKPGGLGLGLSICRSIIEAHNGRLWASPNVPRGAIFRFIAPAHPAAAS